MELKPGYKQTDVGQIPQQWDAPVLGEIFAFKNGLNKAKEFFGHGTPIVNYMDVYGHPGLFAHDLDGQVDVSKQELKAFEVRKGDVFFTRTSETVEEVGITSVMLDEPLNAVFSGFVLRARPKDDRLDDQFKKYCFSSTVIRKQITSKSTYTTRALTNGRVLSAIAIGCPPKPEQRAIAGALSDVDALIGALDKLIAKKRDIKQAAMQQLLTGKQRLPGFDTANPAYKQTEAGLVPEDWEVKPLGDIFSFGGGFSASRDQLSSEGHCYLHYGDIHKSTKTFVDVRGEYSDIPKLAIPLKRVPSKSLLTDGDIVFVDASEDDEGTSRHVVVVNEENIPYISGLHTIAAKSKTAALDNGYKRFCFQSRDIKRQFYFYAVGTKVSGISKTNIARILLPIPPLPEQRAIAAVLSGTDAEIAALEKRRDKTRLLKQGMMQELLTGRIRLV